jgi:hypothetical protein
MFRPAPYLPLGASKLFRRSFPLRDSRLIGTSVAPNSVLLALRLTPPFVGSEAVAGFNRFGVIFGCDVPGSRSLTLFVWVLLILLPGQPQSRAESLSQHGLLRLT